MKNSIGWKIKVTGSVLVFSTLSACAKFDSVSEQIADATDKFGACASYSDKVVATLSEALIQGEELPGKDQLESALRRKLKSMNQEQAEMMVQNVLRVYDAVTSETQAQLKINTKAELLEAITALDIGDQTSPEKLALGQKIKASFAQVQKSAEVAGMSCDDDTTQPQNPPANAATKLGDMDPVMSGALRVMTTAYQNCAGAELPAMTASTPDTRGISVIGNHPDGGLKREVSSVADLKKTHYYIKEGLERDASCFDVPNKPLIYDFGGKPYATTSEDSPIDLFKDAGTGTKVLGIDCSGYVFSAMAASGLRTAPGKKLKASLVYGISSSMMMNPASNGLSCLVPVTFTAGSNIKSGDILAVNGHVVILDVTGSDPFGLARAKSASQCTTSVLTAAGYDFDVLQSSPVKGGIGLDRMRAKDYLPSSSKMLTTMQGYAVSACKVKFGQAPGSAPSSGRVVRHKGTPECLDKPVSIARESCVQSCYSRLGLN
ncbi:MAG: hypothetical protein KF681_12985 [Bdellovibrionaceae bacterium]|nr:hypothetical protein [Pseudobdellovibrionaceae bacterium]